MTWWLTCAERTAKKSGGRTLSGGGAVDPVLFTNSKRFGLGTKLRTQCLPKLTEHVYLTTGSNV